MAETASLDHIPQVQALLRALQQERLGHAVLLMGDFLEPLEQVALKIAALRLHTNTPITHPDCFSLRPAKRSRQITIGDPKKGLEPNTMRKLLKDLAQTSNQGGAKVALIYEADRMNISTANAFLKTLEEPPADTTLLLLTTRPYDLLDTIRSRCFNVRLPTPTPRVNDPLWQDWLSLYSDWLQSLSHIGRDKSAAAQAMMTAYALLARFRPLVETLVKATEVETDAYLDDEEKAALEAGQQKGLRARLFAEIEVATRQHAQARLHAGEETTPLPLRHSIKVLEDAHVLHSVFNMREDTCLEYYLLTALRHWARG